MKRRLTTLLALLFMLGFAGQAAAQMEVTVREINDIPDDNVQALLDAGANLQSGDINALIFNDLVGEQVKITAVIMSDPLTSGLANTTDDRPDRIHVFVRDIAAATDGFDGMGIQLVDGSYETTGLIDVTVGDVVEIVGTVSPFGTAMQISPETVTLLGTLSDFGLDETFMDPVVVTTADVNMKVDDQGGVQPNWSNLENIRGQYVRVENATVQIRDISSDRPNWLISTDGGETVINFYDISLRYRNDRDGYPDGWNKRTSDDGDFEPPVPGSLINMSGFVNYQGDDPFARGVPPGTILSINPFEDSDLEVLESPPQATNVTEPDFIPTSADAVEVNADVIPDPQRTITDAVVKYTTSDDATERSVSGTTTDGVTYTFTIPPQADGVFVIYYIEATDNTGATSASDTHDYRVLDDGINEIRDIQETSSGGPGDTPFRGLTTDMDITAIVQSQPDVSGFVSVQDDPDLGPWTGILLNSEGLPDLQRGDEVHITHATIDRTVLFGFNNESILSNVTLEVVSSGNDFYGYKTFETGAMADENIAKQHEGMLIRFDDVQITDADAGFGEWLFATVNADGTLQDDARADDASPLVDGGGGFLGGEEIEFIQGVWVFAFNNFRLWPEDPATDFGAVINVATEEETLPGQYALHQNFPNPFNPATTIRYDLARTGRVTLEVFDLLGRRITTLVDGEQPVGTHAVTFDARDLASGVYLYRLTAGKQVITKTMLLLK